MISRFFIDRPIFASVLSIVVTLAGGIALFHLPLAMYPQIAPPTVQVDCRYPGASAQVVAETVAAPIEQQVNGVEGMLYMSSQCTNDGSYNLTVTFQHGMDLNLAQVLVQNRVALALPLLPEVIKQAGVTARKRSPDILLSIAINSPEGRYDQLYLSNYALLHLRDELARLPGVSDINMLGQQDYSMRIWVDPQKLAARRLTAGDVVRAVREQNRQVATGQIGQPPVPEGQVLQVTLETRGRLVEPEQFEQVILRAAPRGGVVRLKDVARVRMGAKSQDVTTRVNGRPSASLAIFMLPDANALETGDLVKAKIAELARVFPPGVQYEIRYDTTPFIRESIAGVFRTLQEAVVLVAVVVLLFLQNWRSALIPLIAVPVAIVGTFAVMAALGFSINNLTLFGLVLAIGIVVDDAIVVVEAVEHHMERGLAPRAATIAAMEEVSGPVIAIGLVLSAVFVPCAFISGIVGQFFRQFALTIAASTLISTANSLTLSPALAALLLKPKEPAGARRGRQTDILPRVVLALIGAWAGYELLGYRFETFLQARTSAIVTQKPILPPSPL
ncbi:MAG TPA: efflux RND transporter permease subunit, partial [Isosphaeraceae bacterium]